MKVVDLNILIYAINRDAPNHLQAKNWWETCLSETESVGLPWVVALGFLRITTNPRVFSSPLAVDTAVDYLDDWINQPMVQIVNPSERHWDIIRELVVRFGTASNLTTDCHIAALTIENGGVLYSTDTDFSRFVELKWKNPLA